MIRFAAWLVFLTSPQFARAADLARQLGEGRALALELVALKPAQSVTNSGVLKIRDAQGKRRELPVTIKTLVTATNWQSQYVWHPTPGQHTTWIIVHPAGGTNDYTLPNQGPGKMSPSALFSPFAGSDFWLCDLGLEFLHWPEQRLLKTEMKRGESCRVLESINPQPAPGAYSRVVSWIDIDSGGIVLANAYGDDGRRLKVFSPKKFQKVAGRWQVKELEIYNEKTDSRTTLVFDTTAE